MEDNDTAVIAVAPVPCKFECLQHTVRVLRIVTENKCQVTGEHALRRIQIHCWSIAPETCWEVSRLSGSCWETSARCQCFHGTLQSERDML